MPASILKKERKKNNNINSFGSGPGNVHPVETIHISTYKMGPVSIALLNGSTVE